MPVNNSKKVVDTLDRYLNGEMEREEVLIVLRELCELNNQAINTLLGEVAAYKIRHRQQTIAEIKALGGSVRKFRFGTRTACQAIAFVMNWNKLDPQALARIAKAHNVILVAG